MDYNLKFIKLANQFNYKLNHKSDTRSFNNTKVDPELASEYKVNLTWVSWGKVKSSINAIQLKSFEKLVGMYKVFVNP